jgi:hypothetical protein
VALSAALEAVAAAFSRPPPLSRTRDALEEAGWRALEVLLLLEDADA